MKKRKILSLILFSAAAAFMSAQGFMRAFASDAVSPQNEITGYSGESGFSVYLDRDNTLYAAGSNGSGELGRGFKDTAVKVQPLTKKILENVVLFDTGKAGFVLAVNDYGKLYGWGGNAYGQLAGGVRQIDETNAVLAPAVINLPDGVEIVSVKAGARHSVLLGRDGGVWTFGHNGFGQLGQNLPAARQTLNGEPARLDQAYFGGGKITAIETGEFTSYALSETGDVYAWGDAYNGQLASGGADFDTPAIVPQKTLLSDVKKISAQSTTAMAMTNDGKVFVWGNNAFGQYGIPDFDAKESGTPQQITVSVNVKGEDVGAVYADILCGGVTNFLLSDVGKVYSFGAGGADQLGFDIHDADNKYDSPYISMPNALAPTEVQFYKALSIEEITAGGDANLKGKLPVDKTQPEDVTVTAFAGSIGARTFVRDADGQMWSWGDNMNGLAASGDLNATNVPVRSTLYRNDNYDKEITHKNYLTEPVIGLAVIFGAAVALMVWTEIKRLKFSRAEAASVKST
ncbi:MAG: hypothetical protein LBS99_02025 [Clostridiales bacterium]|jgi:alpha-tubulin suppressor-like RCC1 family protein|nr:hypothetical protein [Clostridiales bacterium]